MILEQEQDDTERYFFSLKVQVVQAKMNSYLIYLFTALFVYKNTCTTYSHGH